MKKPKLVIAIILVCLFITQMVVYAAPDSSTSTAQSEKKKVALIVINEHYSSQDGQRKIDEFWLNPVNQKLSQHYNVSADPKYYESFKAAGYFTVINAERMDIIDILKEDNLDYVILVEFLPTEYSGQYSSTVIYHAQMRMIDIKANKNIYNGRFSSGFKISPIAEKVVAVIIEKLM